MKKEIKRRLTNLWEHVNSIRCDMLHDDSTDWEIEESKLADIETLIYELISEKQERG